MPEEIIHYVDFPEYKTGVGYELHQTAICGYKIIDAVKEKNWKSRMGSSNGIFVNCEKCISAYHELISRKRLCDVCGKEFNWKDWQYLLCTDEKYICYNCKQTNTNSC